MTEAPNSLAKGKHKIALIAVEPDIALNVGAMLRVCAGFGARFEVIEPCGFAFSLKALRRSAMDYAELVEMARHDSWQRFCDAWAARPAPRRAVLLTTAGDRSLWDWRFEPGDAVLVGRESAGASPAVHAFADARLAVPMAPGARSLNVAVAAAVALAEARRQLR